MCVLSMSASPTDLENGFKTDPELYNTVEDVSRISFLLP